MVLLLLESWPGLCTAPTVARLPSERCSSITFRLAELEGHCAPPAVVREPWLGCVTGTGMCEKLVVQ